MFVGASAGRLGEENPGGQPLAARKAFLHLGGAWLVLVEDDKGVWGFDEVSQPMVATWNGGTDMLGRAVEHILKDATADVPVRTGVRWAGHAKLGSVRGKVSAVLPVNLKSDGKPALYIASDAGDRLFAFDGKAGRDVTEELGLSAKSRAAAWGDFNGDGLVDLASWDGQVLRLHLQGKGGSFSATEVPGLTECLDLSAVDAGTPGKAGLIVGTRSAPLLFLPGTRAAPKPLSEGSWPGSDLSGPGPSLVADFDGDGVPDVLQLRSKGSVLYRGIAPGRFAAPTICQVAFGAGRGACLGDWDGDGRLDIFIVGDEGSALWQNVGDGQFAESLKLSGEVGYASKPGGTWVCNGDLNNDGRQDVVILYGGAGPQVFFNRGFRSFGLSASLDLGSGEMLPAAVKGQQAGSEETNMAITRADVQRRFPAPRSLQLTLVVAGALWLGTAYPAEIGDRKSKLQNPGPALTPILRMAAGPRNWQSDATIWRYYEAWQTDVAKAESGALMRIDAFHPRVAFAPAKIWGEQQTGRNPKELVFRVQEASQVTGSPFPPGDWAKPEFDDSEWVRTAVPMGCHYRSLALACLRGRFEVRDPARVEELSLEAVFQGGAAFYLNGQEIGRAFLPTGKLEFDTLAEDYPKETFVHPSGKMLLPQINGSQWIMGEKEYAQQVKDPELQGRYSKRFRRFQAKIPASALRAGTNVLAVEVHRAPAHEAMFALVSPKEMGYNIQDHRNWWWNRASVEALSLTAKAPAGAIVGRVSRPEGLQVWNWPVWERVDARFYGDPAEPLRPICLSGARNGAFSGEVVVSSRQPFRGLKAEVSPLKGPGQAMPRLTARYSHFYQGIFDPLEDSPPEPVAKLPGRSGAEPAMQPVWLTVDVPRDAAPGDYAGTLTVSADGLAPATAPVRLHVSDYILPDPKDFVTYMGFVQSPDTLAIRYGVPMWSRPHWQLIERSLQLLGQVAAKEVTIPLVRKTHFGNEHAMLWWIRRPDGSLQPDLHLVERYLDLTAKHLGKIPTVIFYISEGEEGKTIPWITEFDPAAGELKDAKGPRWGTEEARALWRPAFDGFAKILARHDIAKSLALGYHADGGNGPECAKECIEDLKTLVPDARWVRLGHFWFGHQRLDKGPNGNPYARVGLVGNYGVFWDPDKDKPFYGWQNPYVATAYTRSTFNLDSPLRDYRLCPEAILLTGKREAPAGWGITDFAGQFGRATFLGMRGFAPWGGDFWPVLRGRSGWHDIIARYNDPSAAHWDPRSTWSTTALNNYQVTYVVTPGREGPITGVRLEVLREGLQEAEARIFVQNALLDENLRARLGDDLARRARAVCDERTRALRYLSEYTICNAAKEPWASHFIFSSYPWRERSARLYELAAEVARALGGNPSTRNAR